MPLKPACRRPISEPSSTGTETSRSPWLTPSIARRSWRTGRATAWVASLVATKPAPIAAAAANQIGAIRSFGSVTSRPTGISATIRIGTPEHSTHVSSSRGAMPSERASGGAERSSASANAGRSCHSLVR